MATQAKDWIEIYNVSQSILHPSCADRPPAERWKCVWPQYVLPKISNPWFMLSARFDAYGAVLETTETDIWMDSFNFLWPFGDENLNVWGRAQGEVVESLPTPDQLHSAVFQPGCVTHCGQMQGTATTDACTPMILSGQCHACLSLSLLARPCVESDHSIDYSTPRCVSAQERSTAP